MNEDDLPPQPRHLSNGFGGALGSTISGFFWMALLIGIVAVALYGLKHWL